MSDETRYKLLVRTAAGAKKAEITDHLWLSYTKKVGRPGLLSFGLPQGHSAIDLFANHDQIEVHRRDPAGRLDWYEDFAGIYLLDKDRDKRDVETFTAYVPGNKVMLSWRHVLWLAGVDGKSAFSNDPAESVFKTLVTYNATSSATTAAGRQGYSGEITSPGTITVEADGAGGNAVDWYCAWDNLLDTLYALSMVAGGDYDLVKTAANTWEFRWYAGQLGTDRHASVVFADVYDNLAAMELQERYGQVVTGVVIGGPGEGSAREISSASASGWSQATHVEAFINGSNLKTEAARTNAGAALIQERRAQRTVRADVVQTDALRYGRDYGLGDLVARRVFGVSEPVKISEVTVAQDQDGNETIAVGMVVP